MFGWRWAQESGQRQVVYAKGGFSEKDYYLVGIELKDWERSTIIL